MFQKKRDLNASTTKIEDRVMSKTSRALSLATAAIVVAAAVPALAAGTQQIVTAELRADGSQGATLSTDHVKPGVIQFKVKNISTDMDHELLLVKASSPNELPLEAGDIRVD